MKAIFFTIVIFLFISTVSVYAYVASSTNYRIQVDSINIGGILSTSSNYRVEDTLGEIATGESSSASYKLKAGYQQMLETYLAISLPDDVTMSPAILGLTGGVSNGSATWTVITDDPAGYSLSIKASTTPALKNNDASFADYTPSGSDPDYEWSVNSTDSEFGFTVEGEDIVNKFRDNGNICNAGNNDTPDKCWYYLSSINPETIAQGFSANHPYGVSTTVKFRAESGNSHLQLEGIYTATTTVTVLAL